MDDFKVGDRVKLKAENPFKGSIKFGSIYTITGITVMPDQFLQLNTHCGIGWYDKRWFIKWSIDEEAVLEYEDAIAAQDIMEHT